MHVKDIRIDSKDVKKILKDLDHVIAKGTYSELILEMSKISEIVGIEFSTDYDLWRKALVDKIQGE